MSRSEAKLKDTVKVNTKTNQMEEVDGMEQRFGHLQQLLNLAISKFKENLN